MQVTTIGLDIAKNVFQVHGIDAAEKVVVRKQLRWRVNPLCAFSRARAREGGPLGQRFRSGAPARSYRVGSGTTRSKPLAEGIPR